METGLSAFLPSFSSSVSLPVELTQGSVAFLRGFPTGLSHVPQWCELILRVTVEAVQRNQVALEWTETFGVFFFWNRARHMELLSVSLLRAPPLDMRGELRESFPDETGKGNLSSSGGW